MASNPKMQTVVRPQFAYTPKDVLERGLEQIASGKRTPTKCVVLYLDDNDGNYDVGVASNGMRCSETLALLQVAIANTLRDML